jgi:hypothetical protein
MPKETVRRKIRELVQAGWVVREEGQLFVTGRCYGETAPLRESLGELAVSYFRLVQSLDEPGEA